MDTSQLNQDDIDKIEQMFRDLKKTLKPCSKKEVIRMLGETLMENYILTVRLQAAVVSTGTEQEKESNETNQNPLSGSSAPSSGAITPSPKRRSSKAKSTGAAE